MPKPRPYVNRAEVAPSDLRPGDRLIANLGPLPGPLAGSITHAHQEGWGYRIETVAHGSYWFDYADLIEIDRGD